MIDYLDIFLLDLSLSFTHCGNICRLAGANIASELRFCSSLCALAYINRVKLLHMTTFFNMIIFSCMAAYSDEKLANNWGASKIVTTYL